MKQKPLRALRQRWGSGLAVLLLSGLTWAGCDLGGHYQSSPLASEDGQAFGQEILSALFKQYDGVVEGFRLTAQQGAYVLQHQTQAQATQALDDKERAMWSAMQHEGFGLRRNHTGQAAVPCGQRLDEREEIYLMRFDLGNLYGKQAWSKDDLARVLLAKDRPAKLRKAQYFLVWSFSVPTVTGGIIMVPLTRTP
ncbi:MAG: hypothetical protein KA214_03665 [Neisseriaceae bacterium]|nr:hypothetical protein [Neisseriaceae bacterium]